MMPSYSFVYVLFRSIRCACGTLIGDGGTGQIRVVEQRVKRAEIDWVRLLTRLYCDHY